MPPELERHHRRLLARRRWLRRLLRPLPRRANVRRYPVIKWFAARAAQRPDLWSFKRQHVMRAIYAGSILALLPLYGVQFVLAAAFLGLHVYDQTRLGFSWGTNAYGSLFYLMSWSLDAVALIGLVFAGTAFVRAATPDEYWREYQALHAQLAAHFWYVAVALTAVVFATLYLSPHLL